MTSSADRRPVTANWPRGCVVCKQHITDATWIPFCCEVCWDSADAADQRLFETPGYLDRLFAGGDSTVGPSVPVVTGKDDQVE